MTGSDDERFASWMKAHLGVLHRISRAFAEPADQHDLLQELMIAVWKAAPAFRGDSAATTFIYRVAHNRALTWRKRLNGWTRRTSAAESEATRIALASAEADGGDELLEQLYAAIRQLGPVDRSLILLMLDGLSYRDIAAIHGLSETNVGARISRGRTRISALVEEQRNGF